MLIASGLCVFLLVFSGQCNLVNPHQSLGDAFRQCLFPQQTGNLRHCLGVGAISRLQSLDSSPEFDLIDGLTLTRDIQEYREAYNFADGDPSSLRSIFDSFSHVFARRSMRWDLGFLYPGLAMRVAPSPQTAGSLEFVLDPHREALNVQSLKEAGTGRLLARQFLVPLLLGFKFNIATILPILFGILALLAKKAVVISKFALILSSAFGLGSLLFGTGSKPPQHYYGGSYYNPGYGGLSGGGYNKYQEDEYGDVLYRGAKESTSDQLRLYGNLPEVYEQPERIDEIKGRNFAWSEDEKTKTKNIKI